MALVETYLQDPQSLLSIEEETCLIVCMLDQSLLEDGWHTAVDELKTCSDHNRGISCARGCCYGIATASPAATIKLTVEVGLEGLASAVAAIRPTEGDGNGNKDWSRHWHAAC